jgi:hypothetical protein
MLISLMHQITHTQNKQYRRDSQLKTISGASILARLGRQGCRARNFNTFLRSGGGSSIAGRRARSDGDRGECEDRKDEFAEVHYECPCCGVQSNDYDELDVAGRPFVTSVVPINSWSKAALAQLLDAVSLK